MQRSSVLFEQQQNHNVGIRDEFLPASPRKHAARIKVAKKWGQDLLQAPASPSTGGAKKDCWIKTGKGWTRKPVAEQEQNETEKLSIVTTSSTGSFALPLVPALQVEDDPAEDDKVVELVEEEEVAEEEIIKDVQPKSKHRNKQSKKEKRVYTKWEFGRAKTVTAWPDTAETRRAAVTIQKIARGGWQRLRYKVKLLEWKLANRDNLTQTALDKVQSRTEQRKKVLYDKLKAKHDAKSDKILAREELEAAEGQKRIAHLRRENKKLRTKTEKIAEACKTLRIQNERLENANNSTDESYCTLNDHAKQIQDTNLKLSIIEPKYRQGVERLQEAVRVREQFWQSEYNIKQMYARCVTVVVQLMEDKCRDHKLLDKIEAMFLELEGEDKGQALPRRLSDMLEDDRAAIDDDDSDSDDYDEYTVHTID